MRAVFASWPLEECKAWIEDAEQGLGLSLEMERDTLKYFPSSNSSKEVRDRLVAACVRLGVAFRYNSSVEGIRRADGPAPPPADTANGDGTEAMRAGVDHPSTSHWLCVLSDSTQHRCDRLVRSSSFSAASRSQRLLTLPLCDDDAPCVGGGDRRPVLPRCRDRRRRPPHDAEARPQGPRHLPRPHPSDGLAPRRPGWWKTRRTHFMHN